MAKASYDKLAQIYDVLMGPGLSKWYAKFLGKILRAPIRKKTILDLGCGTGTLLHIFSRENETWGIDTSRRMLAIAKARDPRSTYRRMDIAKFKLPRRFDIILCAFDTINHLKTFRLWKQLFQSVAHHLKDGGIFVFDINTQVKFNNIHGKIFVQKIPCGFVIIKTTTKSNRCEWAIRILKQIANNQFSSSTERIIEVAFPISLIQKALGRHFSSIRLIHHNSRGERLFIVSKKKGDSTNCLMWTPSSRQQLWIK